jgi:MFS family permease
MTEPAPAPSETGRFPALAHRDFRTLWLGMLFASCTMAFQYYAQMWLIYSLTKSALVLGILGAVRGLAMLLFGLYGGALADRLDRRALLILTQSVALVGNAAIGLLAIYDLIDLWQAFALIFLGSATGSIDAPVRQALIPELVPPQHIPNAVALTTAAQMGSFAITPLLAGLVIDALGPGGAYLLSTSGNVGVVIALLALRYRGRSTAARRESVLQNIRQGLVYSRGNPVVLWIIAMAFTTSAFGMALYQGLIAKWASEVLGLQPGAYGALASVWGVGTLAVSFTLSYLGQIRHQGKILVFGSIAFGLSFVLFGLARSIPLAALAYLINGAAWTGASISSTAIIQSVVPNEVRGRVMSLFMINMAAAQMNGLVLGAIAERAGLEPLLLGATILCSIVVIALAAAVPTLRRLDRVTSRALSQDAQYGEEARR